MTGELNTLEQTTYTEARLREIREDIETAQETCDYITFDEFWLIKHGAADRNFQRMAFLGEVSSLESFHEVQYYRELTVFSGRMHKLIIAFKRVMRKLMKFQLLPMLAEQNRINANISRAMQHMRVHVNAQENYELRLHKLELQAAMVLPNGAPADQQPPTVRQLANDIAALREENEALRSRLAALERGGDRTCG